jgi:hypothetical protein
LYLCFGNNSFDFDTLPDNIVAVVREIGINGLVRRPQNDFGLSIDCFSKAKKYYHRLSQHNRCAEYEKS